MTWQNVRIKGFAPDLPGTIDGILLRTQHVVPTDNGYGPIPMVFEGAAGALNSMSLGGYVSTNTSLTRRVYVGTATKLYEVNSALTNLTDRSDTSYGATTTDTWSFTQFGDYILAANKQNILRSANGGAFAAVGIAPTPKASIIVTVGPVTAPVVMAFDYDDGTNNYRDGWFASGINNPLNVTGWTTGTNQCVNGRLLDDVPGPIMAAVPFRDEVVAFKRTGMYLGSYTGDATNPWAWRRLSRDVGCIGKNAVTTAGDVIYWADAAGIWVYDGSYPYLLPGNVHGYWARNGPAEYASSDANRNFFRCIWDKARHLLYVFTGLSGNPSLDICLTWNSISGFWAVNDLPPLSAGTTSYRYLTNAAGTLYAKEILDFQHIITNNNKVGYLQWGANGTEPHSGLVYGWAMTNYVNPPVIKGVRPHWVRSTGTNDSWGSGALYGYASAMDLTVRSLASSSPTYTQALTFRHPGYMYGQLSQNDMTFQFGVAAGYDWEVSPIISLDIDPQGKY